MPYTLLCVECIREIRHIRNKLWYIEQQIQQHYPYCVCGVVFLCVYRWLVQWWLLIRLVHDKFLSSMGTRYEFCGFCFSEIAGLMTFAAGCLSVSACSPWRSSASCLYVLIRSKSSSLIYARLSSGNFFFSIPNCLR